MLLVRAPPAPWASRQLSQHLHMSSSWVIRGPGAADCGAVIIHGVIIAVLLRGLRVAQLLHQLIHWAAVKPKVLKTGSGVQQWMRSCCCSLAADHSILNGGLWGLLHQGT